MLKLPFICPGCKQLTKHHSRGFCKSCYTKRINSADIKWNREKYLKYWREYRKRQYRKEHPNAEKRKLWSQEKIIKALRGNFNYIPAWEEYRTISTGNSELPGLSVIQRYFGNGGFRKAFEAAGITKRHPKKKNRPTPTTKEDE